MPATNTATKSYKLPVRIGTDRQILRNSGDDNGWSMMECDDRADALRVMAAYPAARMPCWQRIERGEC